MKLNITKNHCTAFKRYGEKRDGVFDSIQIHSIGCAQNTAINIRNNMNQYSPSGIVHAIVDAETEGLVLEILPNDNIAWADGGYGNHHSFCIEIAESDYMKYTSGANYIITNNAKFLADINRGYNTAVEYVAKKCKEFGFDPTKKLPNGLHTVYSHQEANQKGLATAHVDPTHIFSKIGKTMDTFRADVKKAMGGSYVPQETKEEQWYRIRKSWADEKSQIGAYHDVNKAKEDCPVGYTVFNNDGKAVYRNETKNIGTQSSEFKGLSNQQAADKILEIARPIALKYNLFPSVIAAQAILESGYVCGTELSKSNNITGMKKDLVNSQWSGSTWDGKSVVTIHTPEYYNGVKVYIDDLFRVYPCIEDCLADMCAFFTSMTKYVDAGIMKAKTAEEQVKIEVAKGYCTDPNYVSKIMNIINKYGMAKYDKEKSTPTATVSSKTRYRVQLGVFSSMANANTLAKQLKDKGFKIALVADGSNIKVMHEKTFKKKENAEKKVAKLKASGFKSIIVGVN